MRVVHLANFYGPRSGGLKTMMQASARELAARGVEVHHVVPGESDSQTTRTGYTKHTVRAPILPRSGGYRVISRVSAVREIVEGLQPDVLEISDRLGLLALADWAREHSIPSILYAHERLDGVIRAQSGLVPAVAISNRMNANAARRVDAVVATTDFAAGEFRRIGQPVVSIPLGVDLQQFHPQWRDDDSGATLRIGLCSRLSREKVPGFAIDVARVMHAQGVSFELHIAGTGPLEATLRKQAEGVPVVFRGHLQTRSAVATFLANCDVLLAPGPIETFGLAALEGMACGTPVVANSSSALAEVLGSSGASAPLDAEAWVEHIQRLTEFGTHAQTAARLTARARAEEFPWSQTADRMQELYSRLLAGADTAEVSQ